MTRLKLDSVSTWYVEKLLWLKLSTLIFIELGESFVEPLNILRSKYLLSAFTCDLVSHALFKYYIHQAL